jgi:hypothetical protein
MRDSSSSDRWPSRRATRLALVFGAPVIVLLGAAAVGWASVTLKTWNDGDTLKAADLNANFAALNAALPKSLYQVWGRTACGGSDVAVHTGFLAGFGSSSGAVSGGPMCLDDTLAPFYWVGWTSSAVSRAASTGNAVGHRSQYLTYGQIQCAVCKGASYVLWGRTACVTGDSALYVGHIGNIAYNATYGGTYNAGPVCVDDAASNVDGGGGVAWADWGGNGQLVRGAGANGSNWTQYLDAQDGPCVVCQ